MTPIIIIVFCALLLTAYLFNLTSSLTKIPSVILLLAFGWGLKQITVHFDWVIPNLSSILPVLATVGLILIVLEGSLELKLNKSKIKLIRTSLLGALIPMLALSLIIAYLFHLIGGYDFKICLINSIPICIISSAIAVPSVENLNPFNREFVIYESSLSDIFGVLFFNFIAINESINIQSFGVFGLELILMIGISMIATVGLSLLLSKLDHHVKFVPIILLVILIYAVSKLFHLPALIFILIFGLSIENLDELKGWRFIRKFNTQQLQKEINKFKDLTVEGAFLIRALFFILFGFLLETKEILNMETIIWSVALVILMIITRFIQLKISKLPISPLLFVAPRGLITILLFLEIAPEDSLPFLNKSLIIQVILLSALFMTFGLMFWKKDQSTETETDESNEMDDNAQLDVKELEKE